MARDEYLFTSESVTEGHPDKIADQISDAVLDAILGQDPTGRVACETLLTTGLVVVAGEITTKCYVDIPRIARDTIKDVGYTRAKYGFDYETCGVIAAIDSQSPDIAMGVDTLPVPNVSTMTETGSATPIAYATCTMHRSARPAATTFFATWRAMYEAERSTFVGSFPEKAPPPCGHEPPYVSTMILRPVRPVSPCGPPVTKRPVGLM